jgi:hypothetical protein
MLFENSSNNMPYLELERRKGERNIGKELKLQPAVINAILVIGVAIWAAIVTNK